MIKPTFWDFNFIDVLSLITYSVIAIYVAFHLKNRYSDQQMKKNIFLRIVDNIEKILTDELPFLHSFMKNNPNKEEEKNKVLNNTQEN